MPPPLPDHLFDQADHLTSGVPSRPTDLRRAISNAYYGLFHFAITAAADMVLGAANQATARYALVYRSVDHAHLRNLCDQVRATNPQKVALVPVGGFRQHRRLRAHYPQPVRAEDSCRLRPVALIYAQRSEARGFRCAGSDKVVSAGHGGAAANISDDVAIQKTLARPV